MSLTGLTGRWYDRRQKAEISRTAVSNRAFEDNETQPFEKLTAFIPVDVITLFVAAIGFISAAAGSEEEGSFVQFIAGISMWQAYFVFAFAVTPVIAVLVYLVKQKEARDQGKDPSKAFPWWPMIAAMIAFLAWAPALPGMISSGIGKVGASFLALLVSTILGYIDRLIR